MRCEKVSKNRKNMLRVKEKAVLLHPLSEGEGLRREGTRKQKFFESLRPAQDRRRGDAPSVEGTFNKGTPREHQGGTRDSEKNLSTTILQRRV